MQIALFLLCFIYEVSGYKNVTETVEKSCQCGSTVTILTAALAIVSAVLLLALIAILVLYRKISKLKNKHQNIVVQPRDSTNGKPTMFAKHETKKPHSSISKTASPRRPTGIAIGLQSATENPDLDDSNTSARRSGEVRKVDFDVKGDGNDASEEDDYQDSDSPKKSRKIADRRPTKFVFNASKNDDDDGGTDDENEDDNSPKEFRKTADRRPTKFVFANSLETEFNNDPNTRRDSANFTDHEEAKITKESRKSVTFDENIERIAVGSEDGSEILSQTGEKTEESENSIVEVLPNEIF